MSRSRQAGICELSMIGGGNLPDLRNRHTETREIRSRRSGRRCCEAGFMPRDTDSRKLGTRPKRQAASGGDGTLSYSLSPSVPGLTFNAATRALVGTPTAAGTYNMTYTARDADGDIAALHFTLSVVMMQMTTVDLVVASVSASDDTPESGQSFDLTATTSNRGTGASAATTLRFYRSTNTTISSSDTEVRTAAVGTLPLGGTTSSEVTLTASSTVGTYYYGACVDRVSGESNTQNNCSSAVTVTVSTSQAGVESFDLASSNRNPEGIVFANNRLFVVDWDDERVYAYSAGAAPRTTDRQPSFGFASVGNRT